MNKSKQPSRREEYQQKKVVSKKSMRGEPENPYGEVKKPVCFGMTPTGHNLLKQRSKEMGLSVSELLERIARGEIEIDLYSDDSE